MEVDAEGAVDQARKGELAAAEAHSLRRPGSVARTRASMTAKSLHPACEGCAQFRNAKGRQAEATLKSQEAIVRGQRTVDACGADSPRHGADQPHYPEIRSSQSARGMQQSDRAAGGTDGRRRRR